MSHSNEVLHVDDAGVELVMVPIDQNDDLIDPSGADLLEIKIQRPDGTTVTRTATVTTAEVEGVDVPAMMIVTEAGDLNADGPKYRWQGHLVFPSGLDVHTKILTFEVEANLG